MKINKRCVQTRDGRDHKSSVTPPQEQNIEVLVLPVKLSWCMVESCSAHPAIDLFI